MYNNENEPLSKEDIFVLFIEMLKKCYLQILKMQYAYLYSDEAVREAIICKEYDFLITGKKYIY